MMHSKLVKGDVRMSRCPNCGSELFHEHIQMTVTFSGEIVPLIEKLAEDRDESVERFLANLIWLEVQQQTQVEIRREVRE